MWRVGTQIPLNVYEDGRAVCQCHSAEDARRIVDAMNISDDVEAVGKFIVTADPAFLYYFE